MMIAVNRVIDFSTIEGPVYTGRDRGVRLRQQLHLDQLDGDAATIVVKIPEDTYSISSSFFLGLFGPSIVKYGTRDKFLGKYKFETSSFLKGVISDHVARGLQERTLFS